MTANAYLTSTGWTSWEAVAELLGDDQCLWTDLGGLHNTAAPRRLPVGATHLWAWRPGRWTRVRLDSGKALATFLTASAGSPGADPGTPVVTTETAGIPWRNHDRARECHLDVTLLRTQGPTPITFAAVRTPAGQDG